MKKDVMNHKASQKRKFDSNDTLQKNEVLDVVDYLLSEVIEISDDDESQNHSKVDSLEEMCGNREDSLDRKYSNECDRCDFKVEDNKKYIVAQKLVKHKKTDCDNKIVPQFNCVQCDFRAKDSLSLKRHMRDVHESLTASTSPPPKRKRKQSVVKDEEITEMDAEEESVKDLSFKLEDMEIDVVERTEEEIYIERSDMMDRKIAEREKEMEEKDTI